MAPPSDSGSSVRMQKLAGAIYAIGVLIPAMILPGLVRGSNSGRFSLSAWILLPALATAFASYSCANRANKVSAAVFGFVAGCSSYWTAYYWASGSRHTSSLEMIFAVLAGAVPALFVYKRWKVKRFFERRIAIRLNHPRLFLSLILIAFASVSILANLGLNQLARHEIPPPHQVWAPARSVYDRYGYWPAVFFTPTLGFVLLGFFARLVLPKREAVNRRATP